MKEGNVSIYGSHKTMKVVKVRVGSTVLSIEKGLCGSGKVLHKKRCNENLLRVPLASHFKLWEYATTSVASLMMQMVWTLAIAHTVTNGMLCLVL